MKVLRYLIELNFNLIEILKEKETAEEKSFIFYIMEG